MDSNEARQHALGYAAGREDSSGERTAAPALSIADMAGCSGFIEFAEEYARGWDRYRREAFHYMPNARDAYEAWQASGARSIYRLDDASDYALHALAADGHIPAATELNARACLAQCACARSI
jgi:hypothetical protein